MHVCAYVCICICVRLSVNIIYYIEQIDQLSSCRSSSDKSSHSNNEFFNLILLSREQGYFTRTVHTYKYNIIIIYTSSCISIISELQGRVHERSEIFKALPNSIVLPAPSWPKKLFSLVIIYSCRYSINIVDFSNIITYAHDYRPSLWISWLVIMPRVLFLVIS